MPAATPWDLPVLNYGRSFLDCLWTYNSVRFWVESRTRFLDPARGLVEDYYQCASCKSEDTFAKKDLFYPDNFDFLPIFGPQWGVIFRRRGWLNPNYKSIQPVSKMWDGPRLEGIQQAKGVRRLNSFADIAGATAAYLPLVAQSRVDDPASGRSVIFEYPIKTMNINKDSSLYQTDTGPIAFLDVTKPFERAADAIELAFAAFNVEGFCDFVVEEPTPIIQNGKEVCRIYHYSRRQSFPAENRLFAHEA